MDDDLRGSLKRVAADYQERISALRRAQETALAVTATAASGDGMVEVEVGAQGQLRAVRLDARAYDRMPPGRLAAAITELAGNAAAEAAARVREVLAPVLPGELPADGDITAWQPGLSDLLNGGVRGGAR